MMFPFAVNLFIKYFFKCEPFASLKVKLVLMPISTMVYFLSFCSPFSNFLFYCFLPECLAWWHVNLHSPFPPLSRFYPALFPAATGFAFCPLHLVFTFLRDWEILLSIKYSANIIGFEFSPI